MAKTDSPIVSDVPSYALEAAARARGLNCVAGIDEAGRGPLAGPVVAAAVVLDPNRIPEGLNDSKKMTEARRRAVFTEILASAAVGLCAAPVEVIDRLNIRGATLWAMCGALEALAVRPDLALVDGRDVPEGLSCAGEPVIGGDGKSLSIAAASIVAKVVRDSMCPTMDRGHPHFDFAQHKGYGTAAHLEALIAHGPTELHRQSFAPVMAARR
ncbi:ribonuclease HII [Pelagibacterium xiamenense]|uniref:ribonuclease HII n=1 Tax=Pelagibacterium xiamenense TaxID=2901140 RepID=UPI001E5A13E3|nr:ribonuclease HII [Pelagibacterium xiamenense]MCD7059268.1 ribonuclease HII [Pelagibacterium xiamenense]